MKWWDTLFGFVDTIQSPAHVVSYLPLLPLLFSCVLIVVGHRCFGNGMIPPRRMARGMTLVRED